VNPHDNYNLLTRDERLIVFLQAISRGDNQTSQAVIDASPSVEVKMIDFWSSVHALKFTTLLHCLRQVNLIDGIKDLWDDRANHESFICAGLLATHCVVEEEAWSSICREYGFDYEKFLISCAPFWGVNSNRLWFDWLKKLAVTKTKYEVSPGTFVVLKIPTVEDKISEWRKTIALFDGGIRSVMIRQMM
jgi:hypothetical protein